jgi:hypothetical protein
MAMNWFQSNRWLGSFLVLLGIGTLVLLSFLFHAKRNFEEAFERFRETEHERNRLERRDPFPDEANFRKFRVHIENYGVALGKFKEELKKRTLPAAPLAPNEFQSRLRQAMLATAEKARANKVKLPENFRLGFDAYTSALPNNEVVGALGQELMQLEALLNILIEARVDSLRALRRMPLTEERGPTAANTPGPTSPQTPATIGPTIIERNIVDLTFVASPSVARKVLNRIASANEQPYVVRTLHVRNERGSGPPREQQTGIAVDTTASKAQPNTVLDFIVGNEHIETSARVEMLRLTF